MKQKLLASLLRDFFEIIDPKFLAGVSDEIELVDLVAGATLIAAGSLGKDVYFIIQGRLRALSPQGEGSAIAAYDIGPGETIGELGFISNGPSPHHIVALRDSTLIRMGYAQFEQTLREAPEIALAVMRMIVARSRISESKRRPPVPPRNICLIGISPGLDAAGFAELLQRYRCDLGDPVRIVTAQNPAGNLHEPASPAGKMSPLTIMVGDMAATGWTQSCLNLADEVVLVADATQPPDLAAAEQLLAARAPEAGVDRTLVLTHPAGTRSPVGTAAWLDARAVKRHVHIRVDQERDFRRLTRLLAGRGVGVVLSGGGARGLAHIGVLNAIEAAGIEIDMIGGTSIGSVIGGWYAMEVRGQDLHEAARAAFVSKGSPIGDYNWLPLVSLSRGAKTRKITEDAVIAAMGSAIDIEDCWLNYFCVAANFSRSTEAVLKRGPMAKSMLASYAIPGVLPPIVLNGHLHVDGGAVNNLAVDVMEREGAGTIIAVDLLVESAAQVEYDWVPGTKTLLVNALRRRFGFGRRLRAPGIADIMLRSVVIASSGRQRKAAAGADITLTPKLPGIRFLDWAKVDQAVAAGFESASAQLAGQRPESMAEGDKVNPPPRQALAAD
jgi:NTE family protein